MTPPRLARGEAERTKRVTVWHADTPEGKALRRLAGFLVKHDGCARKTFNWTGVVCFSHPTQVWFRLPAGYRRTP
jgi:hypothetical protein